MKNTLEITIDALFSVTNLDAYEEYNLNPKNEMKDISFFKKQIYCGDIINVTQGQDGFTVITLDEDGKKYNVRVFETIEEIETIMDKMSLLKEDMSISTFLMAKFDCLNKKNQKIIGKLKK